MPEEKTGPATTEADEDNERLSITPATVVAASLSRMNSMLEGEMRTFRERATFAEKWFLWDVLCCWTNQQLRGEFTLSRAFVECCQPEVSTAAESEDEGEAWTAPWAPYQLLEWDQMGSSTNQIDLTPEEFRALCSHLENIRAMASKAE
ncbi:MAG: hypothetical protein IT158_20000 [Bryobacterales bacterium]|nr:hypothetical protein [Bryobacterales bacterium]